MNVKKVSLALGTLLFALSITLTQAHAGYQNPQLVHPLLGIAPLNTYIVTKTTDSGDNNNAAQGTLRRAMLDANNHAGFDAIVFNIPGSGLQTIKIKNYLPDLTDNAGVMIDGTTSDDRIQIDGSGVNNHHGFPIVSDNNVIKGLIINGVQGGGAAIALLNGANGNVIIGNYLGTNSAGQAAKGNNSGVYIGPNSNGNYIGGTHGVSSGGRCTGDCNLLSGNRFHGVVVDHASNNVIVGNFIGLNLGGTGTVRNGDDGVLLAYSPNNRVGGSTPAERNVIAGNKINIELGGVDTHNNTVQGNYVGINSAGNGKLSNGGSGIVIDVNAHDNTVDRNVVGGQTQYGILVFKGAVRNAITNNRVGLGASSDSNLGNATRGIEFQTNGNRAVGNRVAFNGRDGIQVKSGTGNLVSRNEIFNNGNFGINLGTDAFTANDNGDGDGGANMSQNYPTIKSAVSSGVSLTLKGSLNSRPNTRYTLEFFRNPSCDNTFGHAVGEGKQYLGSANVTTNGSGNATFTVTINQALTIGVVTATATDSAGNTSEFSYCATIK